MTNPIVFTQQIDKEGIQLDMSLDNPIDSFTCILFMATHEHMSEFLFSLTFLVEGLVTM